MVTKCNEINVTQSTSSLVLGKNHLISLFIENQFYCFFNQITIFLDRKIDERNGLFKLIGSQILTICNDAKKITLSAWSWPSRVVAEHHHITKSY